MEEITYLNEEIDRVVDLLNVLKSRYFFLRAKYDIGKVLTDLYPILKSDNICFIFLRIAQFST